jgi:hypothetical protein
MGPGEEGMGKRRRKKGDRIIGKCERRRKIRKDDWKMATTGGKSFKKRKKCRQKMNEEIKLRLLPVERICFLAEGGDMAFWSKLRTHTVLSQVATASQDDPSTLLLNRRIRLH